MVRKNKLSYEQVAHSLQDCLQFLAKGNVPQEIQPELVVLDAWNLDSEHGIELACDLSTRLDMEIPPDENPLIEETGKRRRARTFNEVVRYIMDLSKP